MPKLIYNSGFFGENVFEIAGEAVAVGRADGCEICILHKSLSRRHAELRVEAGRTSLVDLGSKNGTFVNGVRIDRSDVRGGDVIQLGDLIFSFVDDASREPPDDLAPGAGRPEEARPALVMGLARSTIEELLGETQRRGALKLKPTGAGERARDKLRVLLEVSQLLASPGDLEALLESVLDLTFRILDVDRASILLVDPRTSRLEPRATRSSLTRASDGPIHSQHIVDYVRAKSLAALFSDAAHDPRLTGSRSVMSQSIRSSMCAPLKPRSEVIGVLYVDNVTILDRFSDEDLEFLVAFASQAAVAIDNSMLRRRVEEAAVVQMHQVMQAKLAALGALIGGIAHELQNPLQFVSNFAELSLGLVDDLAESLAPQREGWGADLAAEVDDTLGFLRQNAAKIREHGRRAGAIIESMQLHAQGSSGERRDGDLNAIAAESVRAACEKARAKDRSFAVEISAEYDPSLGPVEMAAGDVSRALINIVDNACQAMRQKKRELGAGYAPRLTVRTAPRGDRVEVRVRDNGPGIPEKIAGQIWTPFFTTRAPGEGAGLGLSISRDIVVHGHQGEIQVTTAPGEFTEFVIVLPRVGVLTAS
jgi:signal transduction histidine kinase